MTECHAIVGDIQAPYHDKAAVEVACQIISDAKPKSLTINGDAADCRKLALRYPGDDSLNELIIGDFKEEALRAREPVIALVKAAKPTAKTNCELHWADGNHEYRIWRAMAMAPQTLALLGIDGVKAALNPLAVLGLDKLGFVYHGAYPNGFWLRGSAPVEHNFWIEHGYIVRKKAAYTASALLEERWANVCCGHVERLAVTQTKKVGPNGDRYFYAVEGGTLSVIGAPAGAGIYTGIPHSVPGYMNHHQGFVLLYFDNGQWTPEAISIRDGKAIWRGKVYRA